MSLKVAETINVGSANHGYTKVSEALGQHGFTADPTSMRIYKYSTSSHRYGIFLLSCVDGFRFCNRKTLIIAILISYTKINKKTHKECYSAVNIFYLFLT